MRFFRTKMCQWPSMFLATAPPTAPTCSFGAAMAATAKSGLSPRMAATTPSLTRKQASRWTWLTAGPPMARTCRCTAATAARHSAGRSLRQARRPSTAPLIQSCASARFLPARMWWTSREARPRFAPTCKSTSRTTQQHSALCSCLRSGQPRAAARPTMQGCQRHRLAPEAK